MNVSILSYGAHPDGTLCTREIQASIDDCFRNGGGTVEIPAGTFLTGGIRLRSNITLLLRTGAVLCGSRDVNEYFAHLTDEVEPFPEEYKTDAVWVSTKYRLNHDHMNYPGGRWGNGLIRAVDAKNVAIIGEPGSVIDGMDPYDEIGEENYRGPHGVSMHHCSGITFRGYTIRNTGNWAHSLFFCEDIVMEDVEVLAGHDGIHMTTCDHIRIENSRFFTGDDCVAGIDNTDLSVSGCTMNTACSAFRLGGTHIRIRDCRMFGPAKYLFRGSLSVEEKKNGKPTEEVTSHRYNMLSAYTYYADFSREIRHQPGDIVMEDCTVEHVDRFLHYNYSGNETWQKNRPLKDIVFRNITATHLKYPLTAYGDAEIPVVCELHNCNFTLADGTEGMSFMHLCHFEKVLLDNVRVKNLKNAPLILRWSEGLPETKGMTYEDGSCPLIEDAKVDFSCRPI